MRLVGLLLPESQGGCSKQKSNETMDSEFGQNPCSELRSFVLCVNARMP